MCEYGKTDKYVLAMYDIRGKQKFIYRSRSIKEIVGGSAIIRDCFKDYLMPAAEKVSSELKKDGKCKGIYTYDIEAEEPEKFSVVEMKKHFDEGYIGEVVYDGGGNFLLIFEKEDYFSATTRAFTLALMKCVPTLKVLGTCVPIDSFDDYQDCRKKLYERHRFNENSESTVMPWGSLPISQVDIQTSFPLTHIRINEAGEEERISSESFAKYQKWIEERSGSNPYLKGGALLDEMVLEKDKDSWLAVIYLDGNNMGAKVQAITDTCKKDFETQINSQRAFSREIQKVFVDDRLSEIDDMLKTESKEKDAYRMVVYAGDEITLIVNAHNAFAVAKTYLDNLPKGYSSCAGIALFKSHAPYSEAYRIAEECCENGKKRMKNDKLSGDVNFLDYHVCQGAIGTSLEEIREREETDHIISRPWLIKYDDSVKKPEDYVTKQDIFAVEEYFRKLGRTNIKGLPSAAREGKASFELEMSRIEAHAPKTENVTLKRPDLKKTDSDLLRKLCSDLALVSDFWAVSLDKMIKNEKDEEAEKGEEGDE